MVNPSVGKRIIKTRPSSPFRYTETNFDLAEHDVDALLSEWQDRLRLSDWDVTVEIVPCRTQKDGTLGTVSTTPALKSAEINVLSFAEKTNSDLYPYDMERVLVHELLHLHFDLFFPEGEGRPEYTACEVAIDCIARALVHAKRGGTLPKGDYPGHVVALAEIATAVKNSKPGPQKRDDKPFHTNGRD